MIAPIDYVEVVALSKLKNKKVVALLISIASVQAISLGKVSAITYGDPVGNSSVTYPEVISVWQEDGFGYLDHICSAVLIEQQIAITAAHCVQSAVRDLYVEVGSDYLGKGASIRVNASWYNPRYSSRRIANDVGILHLAEPANVSRLAQLSPKTKITTKSKLLIAGWGADQNGDSLQQLHKLKVKFDNNGAQKIFGKAFNSKTTVAAGRYFRQERVYGGACNGDSGGPLYEGRLGSRPKLVGIVSYGVRGCDENAPTVFARIDYYAKVIRQGIVNVKARAQEEMNLINSVPVTASFSFSKTYTFLNYWSAYVSAGTVSLASIAKWCFFIDDRPVTASEISYGSGEMPFSATGANSCFVATGYDTMTSGEVEFRLDNLPAGAHKIHAVVTDSLGRSVTTTAQTFVL